MSNQPSTAPTVHPNNQPTNQPRRRSRAVAATTPPPTYVSGWHAGPTPKRCSGAVSNPDGSIVLCAHPSHTEPEPDPVSDHAQPVRDPVREPSRPDDSAPHADVVVLATPTGRLLPHHEPETDGWFAQRRDGITATDLPKILGLSQWGNALSVYLDKLGQIPWDDAGEAARWGQLLEDVVAGEWAHRAGVQAQRVGVMAHVDRPWQRASLDRLVHGCPDAPDGLCALEVKTRSAYVAGAWRDDVPDDVYAQVQWQLDTSGLPHVHVAVLLGGQRLEQHTVHPDPPVIEQCRREGAAVWQAVQAGVPPYVEPDAVLADLLDRLHSTREGVVEIPGDLADDARRLVTERRAALAAERAAKLRADTARAGLVQLLGAGEVAHLGGVELYRYRAAETRRTAWREVVKAAPEQWRDDLQQLVAQHTVTSTTRSLILADPPATATQEGN